MCFCRSFTIRISMLISIVWWFLFSCLWTLVPNCDCKRRNLGTIPDHFWCTLRLKDTFIFSPNYIYLKSIGTFVRKNISTCCMVVPWMKQEECALSIIMWPEKRRSTERSENFSERSVIYHGSYNSFYRIREAFEMNCATNVCWYLEEFRRTSFAAQYRISLLVFITVL